MTTQRQIAKHLDISQQQVSELLLKLEINGAVASLDEIRVQYIRKLRAQAAGHKSETGLDLIYERVLTERVDRELKLLQVAEKKGLLINVEQLEPEIMQMFGAFKAELLSRDDKLKFELDSLYGIDTDLNLFNEYTESALSQLARYSTGGEGNGGAPGAIASPSAKNEHHRLGENASEDVE